MTAIRLGTPNANSKTKAKQMTVMMVNVPSKFLREDFMGTPGHLYAVCVPIVFGQSGKSVKFKKYRRLALPDSR